MDDTGGAAPAGGKSDGKLIGTRRMTHAGNNSRNRGAATTSKPNYLVAMPNAGLVNDVACFTAGAPAP
jgi:hypothetical protein